MRYLIIVSIVILNFFFVHGQDILIRQPDSAGHFIFKKFRGGSAITYFGSYDILQGQPVDFMTNWSLSARGELYWTNGENIYQFNCNTSRSKLVSAKWHFILEFCIRDSLAYLIYNPSREEGLANNRYETGLKFCSLNLKNGNRHYFHLPNTYNFTNLSISPDHRWAAFINTIRTRNKNITKYQFVLFDLYTQTLKILDSGISSKYQWFGDDDKHNSSLWQDSATLLYYKHTKDKDYGSILSYNTSSGEINVKLKEIPDRDFMWFDYDSIAFYFSDRNSIYKTINGKDRQVVVGHTNVLDATLYPL
jgi:hypothetical protein